MKTSRDYYRDVLLSQQMLGANKYIVDDNFQQDSTLVHCAHNAV